MNEFFELAKEFYIVGGNIFLTDHGVVIREEMIYMHVLFFCVPKITNIILNKHRISTGVLIM